MFNHVLAEGRPALLPQGEHRLRLPFADVTNSSRYHALETNVNLFGYIEKRLWYCIGLVLKPLGLSQAPAVEHTYNNHRA